MRNWTIRQYVALGCLSIGFCVLSAESAFAQARAPRGQNLRGRPTQSPYLGLLNNNGAVGSGLDYYTIVRPRQQTLRTENNLGREMRSAQSNIKSLEAANKSATGTEAISTGRMMSTGHTTSFGNVGSYFPAQTQPR